MKGLDVAKAFYLEWGQDYLEMSFPELAKRVAIGRFSGSDVLGADDEISKDHNWGPQFTIFLSAEDYATHGDRLTAVMNAAAPNPWNGYRVAGAGDQSVNVACLPDWIKSGTGFSKQPTRDDEWQRIVKKRADGGIDYGRESTLYYLRHGALWYDGSGELSGWRKSLHEYPAAVWRIRLAEELFRVWHHGEYNFVQRVAHRPDPLAKAVCLGEFITGVMRTLLLLNRDYTPYWKWLSHQFRTLDEATIYAPLLEELVASSSSARQAALVLEISAKIYQRLLADGIINNAQANKYLLPLFNAHLELLASSP